MKTRAAPSRQRPASKPHHDVPAGREGLAVMAMTVPLVEKYIETFVSCPIAQNELTEARRASCERIAATLATLLAVTADTPEPKGGWVRMLHRAFSDLHHLINQAHQVATREVGRRSLKKAGGGGHALRFNAEAVHRQDGRL